MKRMSVVLATVLLPVLLAHGGGYGDFIHELNARWVSRDYEGIKATIDARLAIRTNDLPALIAKADFFTTVELNMSVVGQIAAHIRQFCDSLNWPEDGEARAILDAMLDSMEHRDENEAHGFIYGFSSNQIAELHQACPTNYPGIEFLDRFAIVQYGSTD